VQLAAEQLGLKSCWAQLRLRAHDDDLSAAEYVRQLVGLPVGMEVPIMIAVGYPAEDKEGHPRNSLSDTKIHHNQFKSKS
jgi:nitroreductase